MTRRGAAPARVFESEADATLPEAGSDAVAVLTSGSASNPDANAPGTTNVSAWPAAVPVVPKVAPPARPVTLRHVALPAGARDPSRQRDSGRQDVAHYDLGQALGMIRLTFGRLGAAS